MDIEHEFMKMLQAQTDGMKGQVDHRQIATQSAIPVTFLLSITNQQLGEFNFNWSFVYPRHSSCTLLYFYSWVLKMSAQTVLEVVLKKILIRGLKRNILLIWWRTKIDGSRLLDFHGAKTEIWCQNEGISGSTGTWTISKLCLDRSMSRPGKGHLCPIGGLAGEKGEDETFRGIVQGTCHENPT